MPGADASNAELYYLREASFAEENPSNDNWKTVRFTGDTLENQQETTESAEIVKGRQVSDLIRIDLQAAGDTNIEWSYASFDDWLASLLQEDNGSAGDPAWNSEVSHVAGGSVTVTADDPVAGQATLTGTINNDTTIGKHVLCSGFPTEANNGLFVVVSANASAIVILNANAVAETGPTATIDTPAYIVNGSNFSSYAMQRNYSDLTGTGDEKGDEGAAARFLGMSVDAFNIDVSAGAVLTGAFTFLGKKEKAGEVLTNIQDSDGRGNPVMNAIDNVEKVVLGGIEYNATQVTIAYANNGRNRPEIGTLGAESIGSGTIGVTGNIQAYYFTAAEYKKFLAFLPTDLQIWFRDALNNRYIFAMPQVKYSTGTRQAESQNTDVIADLGYTAFADEANTEKTLFIYRIPAA